MTLLNLPLKAWIIMRITENSQVRRYDWSIWLQSETDVVLRFHLRYRGLSVSLNRLAPGEVQGAASPTVPTLRTFRIRSIECLCVAYEFRHLGSVHLLSSPEPIADAYLVISNRTRRPVLTPLHRLASVSISAGNHHGQ